MGTKTETNDGIKIIRIDSKMVKAAAAYWSNFLKNPNDVVQDNGEPSQFGLMNMLAKLAGNVVYPDEDIKTFEEELKDLIEDKLSDHERLTLSVDYHPDQNLSKALDIGIKDYNSMTIFPCKTSMIINNDTNKVEVSEGYGKPWKTIYPRADNTNRLNSGYNYVIFGNQNKDVQIVIDFKYYRCELDIVALKLNLEADSIKITNRDGAFFAEKLQTKSSDPIIRKEIIVREYVRDI